MIILASKSPRRKELLSFITDDFKVDSADVDETLPQNIKPDKAVEYLSKIKAEPFRSSDNIVIGADTVVAIGDKILGYNKESVNSREELLEKISDLQNFVLLFTRNVFTGVTIIKNDKTETFSVQTKVKFFELSDDEINKYISTNEPFDKAGAYGIQGKGSLLVEKIDGDFFNVVGLPISILARKLEKFYN